MLTGDKVGTAKNIATACNILPADAQTLEVTCETFPVLADVKTASLLATQRALEAAAAASPSKRPAPSPFSWARKLILWSHDLADADAATARSAYLDALTRHTAALDKEHPDLTQVRAALQQRLEEMSTALSSGAGPGGQGAGQFCLVLDEKAIEYCGLLCKEVLAVVGNGSRSVVACRARKDQKAQLLNLIRESVPSSCCLAIGDGANDVAMIKAGHVGVGIIGKEGMQAVNNSDFAIGQFRFLRHLLFVHGRFAYKRTALFCYYMVRASPPPRPLQHTAAVVPAGSFITGSHTQQRCQRSAERKQAAHCLRSPCAPSAACAHLVRSSTRTSRTCWPCMCTRSLPGRPASASSPRCTSRCTT